MAHTQTAVSDASQTAQISSSTTTQTSDQDRRPTIARSSEYDRTLANVDSMANLEQHANPEIADIIVKMDAKRKFLVESVQALSTPEAHYILALDRYVAFKKWELESTLQKAGNELDAYYNSQTNDQQVKLRHLVAKAALQYIADV
ncbi:hypothetical protein N7456_001790 [Penicillium angulare]|uniref:Uncharacterized protein n=1 Tax=Penicillium angulare TaxID=116970 RepID=A0A9W9G738_9EURO|nr:hypothetical protein N7456_001790 [Penicillium angulare]